MYLGDYHECAQGLVMTASDDTPMCLDLLEIVNCFFGNCFSNAEDRNAWGIWTDGFGADLSDRLGEGNWDMGGEKGLAGREALSRGLLLRLWKLGYGRDRLLLGMGTIA